MVIYVTHLVLKTLTSRSSIIVEWSERETFDVIDGTKVLYDLRKLEVTINELTHGRTYSVRVAAAGLWGFGDTMTARPLRIAVTSGVLF